MLYQKLMLLYFTSMFLFACQNTSIPNTQKHVLSSETFEFIEIKGGEFDMGCKGGLLHNLLYTKYECGCPFPNYIEDVKVESFYISKFPTTQSQFQLFVNETGYRTTSDSIGYVILPLDTYHGIKKDTLPKKIAYTIERAPSGHYYQALAKDINWNYNASLDSSISSLEPVVFISISDAKNYCTWLSRKLGKDIRLLSSEQWEFAARGGLYSQGYCRAGQNEVFDIQVDTTFLYTIKKNPQIDEMTSNETGIYGMTQLDEIVDDTQDGIIFIRGALVWSRIRYAIGEEVNPSTTFRVAYSK